MTMSRAQRRRGQSGVSGGRVGGAACGEDTSAALRRVETCVYTGVFRAVQAGAKAALESHETWVPENVATFRERRDVAVAALREAGFEVASPRATMYLWVPVPEGTDSEAFARRALLEEGVVVMPGAALGPGGEGFFRIALTQSPERLKDAAERLGRVR